ncbi:hypothetical protein GQ600_25519 [Phytophthora cactorum]|nr:hypothetical protein GQ600_25519 [Phytophthora cactorum]
MDLKPPPRNALDLLYRYIRPGSSLKGQEGRGFFIGEQAFLDFYLQEIVPSATKRNYSEQCSTTETNSEQQNGTVTLAMDSRSMTCENVLAAGSAQNDNPDDIDYTTDRVRVSPDLSSRSTIETSSVDATGSCDIEQGITTYEVKEEGRKKSRWISPNLKKSNTSPLSGAMDHFAISISVGRYFSQLSPIRTCKLQPVDGGAYFSALARSLCVDWR